MNSNRRSPDLSSHRNKSLHHGDIEAGLAPSLRFGRWHYALFFLVLSISFSEPIAAWARVNLLNVGSPQSYIQFELTRWIDGELVTRYDRLPLNDLSFPLNVDRPFAVEGQERGTANGKLTGTTELNSDGSLRRIELSLEVSGQNVDGPISGPATLQNLIQGKFYLGIEVIDEPVDVTINGTVSIVDHFWVSLAEVEINGGSGFEDIRLISSEATLEPISESFTQTGTFNPQTNNQFLIIEVQALPSHPDVAGNSKVELEILFGEEENTPPELSPILDQRAFMDSTFTLDVGFFATDSEGHNLLFSLDPDSIAAGMSIDSSTGLLSWSPTEAEVGVSSVTVTVTDDGTPPLSDSQTFDIHVLDTFHWINPEGGEFATASNWDANEVPPMDAHIFFDLPAQYTVNVGTKTVERVFIGGEPSVDVAFDNADLTVQSTSLDDPSVIVDEGRYTLGSGSLESVHSVIGSSAGSEAVVEEATWENQGRFTVGGGGEAILFIREDGKVRSSEFRVGDAGNTAEGIVSIDGGTLETAAFGVGLASSGSVAIEGGGNVVIDAALFPDLNPNEPIMFSSIGESEGVNGRVVVRGIDEATDEPSGLTFVGITLNIGVGGASGQLVIEDSGSVAVTQGLVVGNQGEGAVTVRGLHENAPLSLRPSSLFVNDLGGELGDLDIWGFEGRAELLVEDLGVVESINGSVGDAGGVAGLGVAKVRSAGRWAVEKRLQVGGVEGTMLEIEEGGTVAIGGPVGPIDVEEAFDTGLRIGVTPDSQGIVRVAGEDSNLWVAGRTVRIGQDSTGQLIVENGGAFESAFSMILGDTTPPGETPNAHADNGLVVVRGFGPAAQPGDVEQRSALAMASNPLSQLLVYDGGELRIEAGAEVSTSTMLISGKAERRPVVFVDGSGNDLSSALHVSNKLNVGNVIFGGSGQLNVMNGGVASMQRLRVEAQGLVEFSGGGIILGEGNTTSVGVMRIGENGILEGNGTVVGSLDEDGGVNNFAGTVLPGTSPGTLTIDGNYTQGAAGILEIQIAGTTPAMTYDQLIVTGDVRLGGTLRLIFLDGFAPKEGDMFELTQAKGTVSGSFASIEVVNLESGFDFSTNLDAKGVFRMTALTDGVFNDARFDKAVVRNSDDPLQEPDRIEFRFSGTQQAGYMVETRKSLSPQDQWVETEIEVIDDEDGYFFEVEVIPSAGQHYYRLRWQIQDQ